MTARKGLSVFLDVNFYDHPKVVAAGERADRLYTAALCLTKRTWSDGFVTEAQVAKMGLSGWQKRAAKLVEIGLFHRDDEREGWWIHDFLEPAGPNRSKATQDAIATKRADAGKKGGRPRKQVAKQVESKVEASSKPCSDLFCSDLSCSDHPHPPPSEPERSATELAAAVGVADGLLERIGYVDETAGADLISYVDRALRRGWPVADLDDMATEVGAMPDDEIEKTAKHVLRGALKKRINTNPPADIDTRDTPSGPSVDLDFGDVHAEYAARSGMDIG